MNREEIRNNIINSDNKHILCELPTGMGKSRVALDYMNSKFSTIKDIKILLVVPRIVLIDNWKKEFAKWGYTKYLSNVEFVTYMSFPKKAGIYDMIIFDEAHHFSERCRNSFEDFQTQYTLLLSATIGKNMRYALKDMFPDLQTFHVSTKSAIQENVLPDPKVYLIPMELDNKTVNCEIVKNKSQKEFIRIPYHKRFDFCKVKNKKVIIECTQQQYYSYHSSLIEWYKKQIFNETFKNLFLQESGKRLKWLSDMKTRIVLNILNYLKNHRTLTFCNSILQTEVLGTHYINSKDYKSTENLRLFNNGKINHITTCNMLDEGINLVNCEIGIYAVLNSSERMITQKLGRLLRHPSPVIIIPYFKNTRDEEIVNKMMENYNPELITTITDLNQLKL